MQLLDQIQTLNFPAKLPTTLLKVAQRFEAPQVDNIALATRQAWLNSGILRGIAPGDSVAVGVGSRGITNLALIVKETVALLREIGAEPFIVPAMGSHAGATAAGQCNMLHQFGVTPEMVEAEIRATMEVNQIGQVEGGPPVYQDKISAAADHTLLINRIKPHTSFRSKVESGLAKMAVIGLGKQHGAATMHSQGVQALKKFIAPAARIYETRTNLRGGLALLENAYHQTADIVALTAAEIGSDRETLLLERAKELMARLPFEAIDVLVVRQLGKNVSGTGLDTNVIGRLKIPGEPESTDGPNITVIAVLDLTEQTHGNSHGIGLANVTTARVAAKIDWQAMYTNAISSGILGMWRAHLPVTLADDRQALQVALRGCGQPQETARLVFIEDTMNLADLWISPNLRETVEAHPRLSIVDEVSLAFDEGGVLCSPWELA